ncbi:MAG: hypothetical protein RBS89_05265 [Candidatus Delongbacteria bacterium]|jgi:hypothetical protein|nr:hypothetical protein [Candidatus Delongbacteria bacterium]
MPRKKIDKDEPVFTEAEANEDINEPEIQKPLKVENSIPVAEDDEDDDNGETVTFLEKILRLELGTKTGLICTILFFLAFIFRWYWFNTSWWLVLLVAAVGLKTLYTQMTDLKDEKPEEAKIAKYSFITLIVLFVIRDLYITYHLDELLEDFTKMKDFIK